MQKERFLAPDKKLSEFEGFGVLHEYRGYKICQQHLGKLIFPFNSL
jgi:hypothetical protein